MQKEKVIESLEFCIDHRCGWNCHYAGIDDCEMELKADILAMLKEQPEIVRCKDCIHNGKVEKCVLAAIAAEKGFPLFMLDNRGEWFCADGKRR